LAWRRTTRPCWTSSRSWDCRETRCRTGSGGAWRGWGRSKGMLEIIGKEKCAPFENLSSKLCFRKKTFFLKTIVHYSKFTMNNIFGILCTMNKNRKSKFE
jgi:hypothetical protein